MKSSTPRAPAKRMLRLSTLFCRPRPAIQLLALLLLAGCGASSAPAQPPASSAPALAASPSVTSSASAPNRPGAVGPTHIKIGVTSKDAQYVFVYLAQDLGLFAKHGLDAEMVVGQPPALTAALDHGEIDFFAAPNPVLQGAEKGLAMRVIFVAQDQPLSFLVGDIGISQVSQLKGTQIATSPLGQIPALATITLLGADGLQPSDYGLVSAGTDPERTAFLANHAVAAALIGFNEMVPLSAAGHQVLDSTIGKVYFPINGLGVSTNTLDNRRDIAQRAVDTGLEAIHLMVSDKAQTVGVLEKDFDLKPDDAGRFYDLYTAVLTSTGRPSPKAVQFQLQSDAKILELAQPFKEDQLYDYSLLPQG